MGSHRVEVNGTSISMLTGNISADVLLILFFLLGLSPFLFCCCRRPQEKTEDRESAQNITMGNTRRNAVIQLADAIIPEIVYEEQCAYPLSSSRNFQESLSVNLPPEIILTPS